MPSRPVWRIASAVFLLVVTYCYCTGVLAVARTAWWVEALLTLGMLAASVPFFANDRDRGARIRLLASETVFLGVALTLRALTTYGVATGRVFDHGFALFFLIQIGGFLVQEVKERSFFTVPMSGMMGVGLGVLYLRGAGVSAADGVVTFWGETPRSPFAACTPPGSSVSCCSTTDTSCPRSRCSSRTWHP